MLPLTLILSTVTDVKPAISVVVSPGLSDDEPRVIALTVTSPPTTVKSVELNVATPGFVDVANSAETVNVSPEIVVSIPSPP